MIMESVMCFWHVIYWCFHPDFDQTMEITRTRTVQTTTSESRSFDKGCAQREDKKAEEGAARKDNANKGNN
jgi:hypothetical protein